jgi:hypothetical protein
MSRHLLRHREQWTNSRLWLYAKRVGMAIFFIAVLALLAVYARKVNWSDVIQAMARYPLGSLLMAFSLAVFSYVLYGVYDLIGRAYCRHKLAVGQVMLVSFICYAFTLTLSAWGRRDRDALPPLFPAWSVHQRHYPDLQPQPRHQLAGFYPAGGYRQRAGYD